MGVFSSMGPVMVDFLHNSSEWGWYLQLVLEWGCLFEKMVLKGIYSLSSAKRCPLKWFGSVSLLHGWLQ